MGAPHTLKAALAINRAKIIFDQVIQLILAPTLGFILTQTHVGIYKDNVWVTFGFIGKINTNIAEIFKRGKGAQFGVQTVGVQITTCTPGVDNLAVAWRLRPTTGTYSILSGAVVQL